MTQCDGCKVVVAVVVVVVDVYCCYCCYCFQLLYTMDAHLLIAAVKTTPF